MDGRERVFTALEHREPDRVPLDFWATAGFWRAFHKATGWERERFLEWAGVDFRYIAGPQHIGTPLPPATDIWGVRRRQVTISTPYGTEVYQEVAGSPLAALDTADEIEAYAGWPSPDSFDYSVVREQCLAIRNRGLVAVFEGDRLNRIAQLKPAMYLRGVDQILMDMAINKELAHAVIGRVRGFYEQYLERILEAAGGLVDIVLAGDDFGQQRGLLVSPAMWEEFLAAGFRRYMDIIHAHGAVSMHHTCGDVREIAARMHALGLDVLQSLQPEAMADALAGLKDALGAALSFHGGVSVQHTLPLGTPADVEREVAERIGALAAGGGYILCTAHNAQADCPAANILALIQAHRRHGAY